MRTLFLLPMLLIFACSTPPNLKEQSIKEITEAEMDFAAMAREVGINEAFIAFADDSAVLDRNNHLISGIDSIKAHFN